MINEVTQMERSSRNTWKARRQRRKAIQACKLQEENAKFDNEVVKKQQQEEKCKEGLVLVE